MVSTDCSLCEGKLWYRDVNSNVNIVSSVSLVQRRIRPPSFTSLTWHLSVLITLEHSTAHFSTAPATLANGNASDAVGVSTRHTDSGRRHHQRTGVWKLGTTERYCKPLTRGYASTVRPSPRAHQKGNTDSRTCLLSRLRCRSLLHDRCPVRGGGIRGEFIATAGWTHTAFIIMALRCIYRNLDARSCTLLQRSTLPTALAAYRSMLCQFITLSCGAPNMAGD